MKHLSKGEAFRELARWSDESSVGFNFARSDAAVNVSMRNVKLEVREPSHLLLGTPGSVMTQLFCADDAQFSHMTADEFAAGLSGNEGVTPPFETALCVLFPDKDFCLIFSEKE